MKEHCSILVIGANGGVGRNTVELALAAGHRVTALVRNPANLPITHPLLQIVQGDVMEPGIWEKYLEGQDLVVSALGVKGGLFGDKPTTLYSQGNANLLRAAGKNGVRRLFFISASAIEISPVLPFYVRFFAKYVIQKLLRYMYADLREMEQLVRGSSLNWTIMRPPQLTDKPITGNYRFAINGFLKNSLKISRADLAHFMINNIDNQATYKSIIEIGY